MPLAMEQLQSLQTYPLLTVGDVASMLNVAKHWVWDYYSRKAPYLSTMRMGDGALRCGQSEVGEFVRD